MDEEENLGGWVTIWAVVAAALIAAIASLLLLVRDTDLPRAMAGGWTPEAYAYLAMHIFFYGGLVSVAVWAVLHFGFVRWTAPYRTSAYFLILLATVVATDVGAVVLMTWVAGHQRAHDEAALREADAELDKAFAGPDGGPVDMYMQAKGEAGDIVRIAKELAAANRAADRQYLDALKGLDFPAFMMPKRLVADRALADTRARLGKARAAVKAYRLALTENANKFRAAIDAAKISRGLKTAILSGYNERMASIGDLNARIMACDDAVFAEYQYEAEDLLHAKGRWMARSAKMMVFADPRDLQVYRAHNDAVQGFVADEKNTQKTAALMRARDHR